DQMLVYDTHFGNDLLLEDGKTYILCFYAASWVDDPNNPVQTPGVVCLELDHLKSGIQTVEAWSAPSSSGWDTLSWTKYNYIFDFDESDPPEAFIIKNCSNNGGGVVIDGVSISQIESPDTVATDACGQGSIRLERWNQISGTSLSNLRTNKNFPNKPDAVTFLSNFQSENNGDDNYGSRVTGYLHPPQTGSYVFTL